MSILNKRIAALESKGADGVLVCLTILPGMTLEDATANWLLENNATELPSGGTQIIFSIYGE